MRVGNRSRNCTTSLRGSLSAATPEGLQRRRVELPQRRAELIELALPGPDQTLVGSGQDLDRLGQIAITSYGPVDVAIGPGQLGQDPGVTGVGLRPRGRVPLPIARHQQRVDRQHPVTSRDQRTDEQAPVGLGRHHDLARVLDQPGDQLMEPGHPLHAFGQPATAQTATIPILNDDIVVILGPVMADEHVSHPQPPRS